MSNAIMLTNVRISFPVLITPKPSAPGGPEKYSADFLFLPNTPNHKNLMTAIQAVAVAKWKDKAQTIMGMIANERKLRCFGKGEERVSTKTLKPFDGYDGVLYVSALSNDCPTVFDANGAPIPPSNTMAVMNELRRMYGGCYVNAAIAPWAQDNTHGRAMRCELIGIQFAGDGEPFGEARPDVSGLFDKVAVEPDATNAPVLPSFMSGDVLF